MKNIDVAALGELLIDFTENGISKQGNPVLEANPGGAPCNVLAMLKKLGKKAAFIGKVGNDMFGKQLKNAITEAGIITDGLIMDPEYNTTLAFVHNEPNGERDFSFYRVNGADVMLTESELNMEIIENASVFHFGTLSMTQEPGITATKSAVLAAEKAGAVITFDPNLREPLWDSLESAHAMTDWGLRHANMLKISDNEIQWFTGMESFDDGIDKLLQDYPNIKLLLLSLGPDGSIASTRSVRIKENAILNPATVETTGAGDTFCACIINFLLEKGVPDTGDFEFTEEELRKMLKYANTAASIVTTRYGALMVMPTKEEIEAAL